MGTLVMPRAVRRTLLAHARRDRPNECCGLLLGRGRRVMYAVAMRNIDEDPRRRYRLDARQHIDLRRVLRQVSPALDIVGVYHSHPAGPARPSDADVAEALYPEWRHVVIGLAGATPQIRAFRFAGGRSMAVRLVDPVGARG